MPETSKALPVVMVSSTALDLPEHRKEVLDACMRQSTTPKMQEHLPASGSDAESGAEAVRVSLGMVDEAEIYIGVFAHRYGYVPAGHDISITEMEYKHAVERGIERMIFLMHDDHPLKASDVETGEGAERLKRLKERLKNENAVNFFKSPEDLRAHVINSLAQYSKQHGTRDLTVFHYVSNIPQPPEAFIAHPYTLLQTHRLVGRQPELNLLTDWVAKPDSEVYKARILNVVAIGGLGKSALTWKWFNDIAPQEMNPLAGRMWWSFYESDATFENFVSRALAYVSQRKLDEVQQIPAPERETQLLAALDREPFLIVLDGLERMLIAYARMDAAHLSDDDYDRQTANFVANAYGLPASAAQSFMGEHRLRKTADPRAGAFLRKLADVRAARILVSTRLYPADLQTMTGEPLGSCAAIFLRGLANDDALELWRALGVSGARDSLLLRPLFDSFDKHPLLIQALASEVARYRPAPGDFEQWRRDNPDFDPFSLPLVQVKSHVLEFALRGLNDKARRTLQVIAAFRMPARYDTLAALLIGKSRVTALLKVKTKPCADERELDKVLTELEDRGLVGWDKRANRYDLHPIVRGVVWSGLSENTRHGVYASLHAYFEALAKKKQDKIRGLKFISLRENLEALANDRQDEDGNLEDLTPAIELYNTLIGLGRCHDAVELFSARLAVPIRARLKANRQRIELLEMLFPDGLDQLPRLSGPAYQAYTLTELATGYRLNGQPGRAVLLYRRANSISSEMTATPLYLRADSISWDMKHEISWDMKHDTYLSVGLLNLSFALRQSGLLWESEAVARRTLVMMRKQDNRHGEVADLCSLGSVLATRGLADESESTLRRSLRILAGPFRYQQEGYAKSNLTQRALWLGEFAVAQSFANHSWKLAHVDNDEGASIRAARLQGEAALGLSDFDTADERLHDALTRARVVNLVDEELSALVALAELRRRQEDLKAAREFLDDIWDAAERGPYPLIHADACNVLADIERDAGDETAAVEAAGRAYRLAWCDGPPFAYHWGLEKARGLLRELGAEQPEMPAFDESKFESMPEVEIDPPDEFGAKEDSAARDES